MRTVSNRKGSIRILMAVLLLALTALVVLTVYHLLVRNTYPLEHEDLVMKYSREYALDPYLVCGVIKTESGFKSDSVSRVGAIGLMQVMPSTAEWIADKLGEEAAAIDLTDPETNIRYGCWYLRFLMDRFGDDIQAVLAAYNAGHNKVSEWLSDEAISPDGTLTEIPYPEAKKYVEKVNRAVERYRELYDL